MSGEGKKKRSSGQSGHVRRRNIMDTSGEADTSGQEISAWKGGGRGEVSGKDNENSNGGEQK